LITGNKVLFLFRLDTSGVTPVLKIKGISLAQSFESFILNNFLERSELEASFWDCTAVVFNFEYSAC
jgi:hypothetical protein